MVPWTLALFVSGAWRCPIGVVVVLYLKELKSGLAQ